jgi:hypothetical protein
LNKNYKYYIINIMKLLQESDFENLKLNDTIFIEESYNKKYKYIGTFLGASKNSLGSNC